MNILDRNNENFELKTCTIKVLPRDLWDAAAKRASLINPRNKIVFEYQVTAIPELSLERDRLSVLTQKYWRSGKVELTTGFVDNPANELKTKILLHLNAWGKSANVVFLESNVDPVVRISRISGEGHWSYVGTDILLIRPERATMNLDSFTINTPESEFYRVVRHEAGHTLGFPHEHMRRELIERLDIQKTVRYFSQTQGWSKEQVLNQVLTPLDEESIFGSEVADETSIMCYQIPETITIDGQPIIGGTDITPKDFEFASRVYPK